MAVFHFRMKVKTVLDPNIGLKSGVFTGIIIHSLLIWSCKINCDTEGGGVKIIIALISQ